MPAGRRTGKLPDPCCQVAQGLHGPVCWAFRCFLTCFVCFRAAAAECAPGARLAVGGVLRTPLQTQSGPTATCHILVQPCSTAVVCMCCSCCCSFAATDWGLRDRGGWRQVGFSSEHSSTSKMMQGYSGSAAWPTTRIVRGQHVLAIATFSISTCKPIYNMGGGQRLSAPACPAAGGAAALLGAARAPF